MRLDQRFRLASAFGETILAISVLGGYFILVTSFAPLLIMLVLHILTIVYGVKLGKKKYIFGSVFGILLVFLVLFLCLDGRYMSQLLSSFGLILR